MADNLRAIEPEAGPRQIDLSPKDQKLVLDAMANPPEPNDALKKMFGAETAAVSLTNKVFEAVLFCIDVPDRAQDELRSKIYEVLKGAAHEKQS